MSSDNSDIKLTGPENWKLWNHRFINVAEENLLWDLVDPKSNTKGAFLTRPIKPSVSDYPKRLEAPAANTRAASSGSVRESPAVETHRVDTSSAPTRVSEMTAEGKEQYHEDIRTYTFEYKVFQDQAQKVATVSTWLRQHVAPGVYTAACKPGKKLHEWYAALKERAGVDKVEETRQAVKNYNAAIKPLSRKPKDMHAWLQNWQAALEEAQEANLPGAKDSATWWPQFAAAVEGTGYDSWCESYRNSNRDAIDEDRLTVHKLVKDFRERLQKDGDVKSRTVAKGAFVTWVDELDSEAPDRSRRPERSPVPSRSRSPARKIGKRRYTGGSKSGCPACDGNHPLDDCWAARPEIRPLHRRVSTSAERLARERMEKDDHLRQLVESLRKKVKLTDDAGKRPLKGIIKESTGTADS